ncbi:MAG: hypothetical protein OHK0013_28820 [Sandaracinaceae bacterium]
MTPPRYVTRFRDALLEANVRTLAIDVTRPQLQGRLGISTATRLQYNHQPWQLLGRSLEFSFGLPKSEPLEVSVQLYLNVSDHWRLFSYCKGGLLFSLNLTRMRDTADIISLEQRLLMSGRSMQPAERAAAVTALAAQLRRAEVDVSDDGRVACGTFDGRRGSFLDTTPKRFVRDFVVASVLKGHFMANKGYSLPGLRSQASSVPRPVREATTRAISAGLRYRVLERDGGRCLLCGASAATGARLHVDHIQPWSSGGRSTMNNLQTLCERCNLGKGNRSSRRFRPHA